MLRGATPDLLITDLNLAEMSGFELLSVLRKRFPQVGAIAFSGKYTPANMPSEALCDAFVAKAPNFCFELMEQVRTVMQNGPIRASRARTDIVPVWIPRPTVGYIVLTCPECLRSFSVIEPKASPAFEQCVFCGGEVRFEMSVVEQAPESPLIPSSCNPARFGSKLAKLSPGAIRPDARNHNSVASRCLLL